MSYVYQLHVNGHGDRWYVAWPDGSRCWDFKVYKRAQDAKSALTRTRNYDRETEALAYLVGRM